MMKKYICFFLLFVWTGSAAAADCTAIGRRIATEQGGQLTKTVPVVQNGRNICVVIIIVPGRNGEKPRRVEVAVPAS